MTEIKDLGENQIKRSIARGWAETKDEFIKDDMRIYYDKPTNRWILTDDKTLSTDINIPLTANEVERILHLITRRN